ncbi:MAG: nuclear transport factor 2 family protein [Pseudomonadota bacterium]
MDAQNNLIDARSACQHLIASLAYLIDHRRYDDVVALFTQDGVFERPGLKAAGRAQILDFLENRPSDVDTRHVCALPFFLEVSERKVVATTYVTIFHGPAIEGSPTTIKGTAGVAEFHDVCTLTSQGWRLSHHESRVAMLNSNHE